MYAGAYTRNTPVTTAGGEPAPQNKMMSAMNPIAAVGDALTVHFPVLAVLSWQYLHMPYFLMLTGGAGALHLGHVTVHS